MDNDVNSDVLRILERLLDGQKRQLEMQEEALQIQRTNLEMLREQFGRATRIQDRAEKIQQSGSQLVETARKSAIVFVPVILLLLLSVGWLIFRMF